VIVTEGVISFTIGGDTFTLGVGDVAVIPRGVEHSGESIIGEAVFIEVFTPLRIQNLLGFLGESFIAPERK
jgi:quercetin dioxygenase-like cupin family protein